MYYRGQIFIPGTGMNNLTPIMGRQPQTYTIPAAAVFSAGQNHLSLGYTDDNYGDNGYTSHDNGTSNQCDGVGPVTVTVDIQPLPAPVVAPASASYTLTLESVMVRRTRSEHTDTNFIGGGVTVNGTSSQIASQPLGNWGQGNHVVNFPILVTEVAPTDRLAINYALTNAGHGSENQIDDAITGVVASLGSSIPVVGSVLSGAANVWKQVFNVADADCDGLVAADSIAATGCGSNSYYEVTYSIAKGTPGAEQPFSVAVAVPSLATRGSAAVKLQAVHK
jgi:hypothetical protein